MIIAFVIFWVVLGLAVFFTAMRGGQRGKPTPGESRAAARLTLLFVTILFAFGIAVPTLVLAENGAHKAADAPGGVVLTAAEQHGRYLFGQACNVCHTLAASESFGKVGPNLDDLRPPEALVLNAIMYGRERGHGNMPEGLYAGANAQDVAAYVAAVAGH